MRRSGTFSALALLLLGGACVPRYGFSGGGLPSHIRTMAIQPFDNETPTPELQRELLDAMHRELQSRLGVRDAPEARSDAVVRGVIRTYDADVPVAYSSNPAQAVTARRRLRISLDVQIVDLTNNRTIWEKKSLSAEGDYAERDEVGGRRDALKRIVNDIVEGAQSQW
ncbi:MAG: Rare lipoprotein [Gemmatimonadetes bacterium]|nr:Rare lipoprotein [Gemmatimonadota bacterium]